MSCRNVRIPHSASRYPFSSKLYRLNAAVVKWENNSRDKTLSEEDKIRDRRQKPKKKTVSPCLILRHPSDMFPLIISNASSFSCGPWWRMLDLAPAAHRPPAWAESIRNRAAPIHRLLPSPVPGRGSEGQWENSLSPILFLDKLTRQRLHLHQPHAKTWTPTEASFSCGAHPGGGRRKAMAGGILDRAQSCHPGRPIAVPRMPRALQCCSAARLAMIPG